MKFRFPWKPRSERKADIEAARREAVVSRRKARDAREIENDLRRMIADNHFAEMIRSVVTGGSTNTYGYSSKGE